MPIDNKPFISKSTYLDGLKCRKLVWFRANAPERIPKPDKKTQATFDFGHFIGERAKRLFPDGINIDLELSFQKQLERSKELLVKRVPVFEAGFIHDNAYARADVLEPAGKDKWDIVEVKCGRSVADVNCHDIAFQKFCYTSAGLRIRKCFVMHVREGISIRGRPPDEMFNKADVTKKVEEFSEGIEDRIREIRKAMAAKECPAVCMGEHCEKPYCCIMRQVCAAVALL